MSDTGRNGSGGSVLAAVCQLEDHQGGPTRSLSRVREAAAAAAQRGAQVVCVPEAFLCGYTRDPELARERGISLSSPGFRSVCRQLSQVPATVILGVIEADGRDLFNTATVITAGRLVARYRKRHLVEECFSPGRALSIFAVGPVRFGIGICSDARDAQDAIALRQMGADAIFYLLNNMLPDPVAERWRTRHISILQSRARQAGLWVLSADVTGTREKHRSYGCTTALDPTGTIIDLVPEPPPAPS